MNDKYGDLEKLAELKEKGIITEEEFQNKKEELLGVSSDKEQLSDSNNTSNINGNSGLEKDNNNETENSNKPKKKMVKIFVYFILLIFAPIGMVLVLFLNRIDKFSHVKFSKKEKIIAGIWVGLYLIFVNMDFDDQNKEASKNIQKQEKQIEQVRKLSDKEFFALCRNGEAEELNKVIDGVQNLNIVNMAGESPLLVAIKNNNIGVLKVLVETGVDVNKRNTAGITPLMWAIDYNNIEATRLLIENGADVKAYTEDGISTLEYAAKYGDDKELIKILLENGVESNIYTACALGNLSDIKQKVNEGAEISFYGNESEYVLDENGWSPIMWAAKYNYKPEVFQFFADYRVNSEDEDDYNHFTLAARNPNIKAIKKLMEMGNEIRYHISDDGSALMVALQYNSNMEIIKHLINKAKNYKEVYGNGDNAIVYALKREDTVENKKEIINLLLEEGADINNVNEQGKNVLYWAKTEYCSQDIIEFLKDKGAKENVLSMVVGGNLELLKELNPTKLDKKLSDGTSPLMLAARYTQKPSVIRYLIEQGANVNHENKDEKSALDMAAIYNNPEMVRVLIEEGASLNSSDFTSLMWACSNNSDPEVISVMIDKGANVNARTDDGWTPLMSAAYYNNSEVVKVLIDNGVKVDARKKNGYTALFYAAKGSNDPEVLRVLIENDADVGAEANGFRPISLAAKYNHNSRITEVLLNNHADEDFVNANGRTPLMAASSYNYNPKVVSVLIENGAYVNYDNSDGWTSLSEAAESNIPQVVKLLIENGAHVNDQSEVGNTPLHRAAMHTEYPEVINILLENGADATIKNNAGRKAIEYVEGFEARFVVEANKYVLDTDAYWNLKDESFN